MKSEKDFNLAVHPRARLSDYTTFRLGGPCESLIDCPSPFALIWLVRHLSQAKRKYLLIGGGSNLLVSDRGLPLTVIRFYSDTGQIERDGCRLAVSACTSADTVSRYAAAHGLSGFNFISGIPGTVGGAIVGNAGAFGCQVSDVLESVDIMTPSGRLKQVKASELAFGYRDSVFKKNGGVIVSAVFKLFPGNPVALKKERQAIFSARRAKHPDWKRHPSAGSVFKNIETGRRRRESAGLSLERAGVKTMRVGGAKIFKKHANIIVAQPNACAQDVYDLLTQMAQSVRSKFNIRLKREIRLAGRFRGQPRHIKKILW